MPRTALAVSTLAAALLAGCATAAATAAKAPATGPDAVVARYTGGVVTAGELDAATYDARKDGLEQLVLERLVTARAKSDGISTEALLKREVADKVSPPSDAEVEAIYQAQAARQQLPPLEQIKDKVVQYLLQGAQAKAQQDFVDRLKTSAKLEVLLPAPRFTVAAEGPSKGPEKAPVTIVEFSDFECPYCARGEASIREVLRAYEGKVRVVYRDFPLPMHPHAQKAAEAAHCAGDQGKYWEMHEKLFASQQALEADDLSGHARALGLDGAKFAACLDSGAKAGLVEASVQAGKGVGVTGTPAFFVNGLRLSGAQPFSEFKALIDQELARK